MATSKQRAAARKNVKKAAAAAKKLNDDDDPTLKCIPTAFGTLNVSLFDVGAVGQIISTPELVVMLTETFHAFRLIPTNGRPHREDVPPSYRGDSGGHWDGDVFEVETKNFTDDTWMWAEGRVSPHSDQLRIVENAKRTAPAAEIAAASTTNGSTAPLINPVAPAPAPAEPAPVGVTRLWLSITQATSALVA